MRKSTCARRASRGAGVLTALLVIAAAPSPAAAASTLNCEGSALRGALLTAPAIEPVTANKGQSTCNPAKAGGTNPFAGTPLPISLDALFAQTVVSGSDARPGSISVGASGGLLDARVKTLPDLPLQIPIPAIPDNLSTITIPVSALSPITDPLSGLPVPLPSQDITIDIRAALQALLPDGKLPNADILRVQAAVAYAAANCQGGKLAFVGASKVAGLSVLGQELPTDQAVDQTVRLIDTPDIDPSNIDVSKLPLPTGIAPQLLPQVQALIKPALDALPSIAIPETLVRVKTTPNQTIREGDRITQRALQVEVSLLGVSLANVVVGEASVLARGVECAGAVAGEQLACTKKRLALVDVLRRGNRVRLFGVADRALVGKRVSIRFTATGRQVARPVVTREGTFSATAPLPPVDIRATNRARYQAVVGREKSLELKLVRRMVLTRLSSRRGKVTIAGRVILPLGKPVQTIVVKRRVSCKRTEVVARIKPSRTGAFRVTVDAPPKTLAATYRMSTRVRKFERNPKMYDTYTLPRAIEIL